MELIAHLVVLDQMYMLKGFFEKLGVEPIEAYSKLFGAWEWEVTVSEDFDYEEFKKWMKMEMDRLYEMGHIRGAQWNKVDE